VALFISDFSTFNFSHSSCPVRGKIIKSISQTVNVCTTFDCNVISLVGSHLELLTNFMGHLKSVCVLERLELDIWTGPGTEEVGYCFGQEVIPEPVPEPQTETIRFIFSTGTGAGTL